MPSAEELRRRIKGTRELGSVVRTMKTLAAVSVHHYEEATDSLAVYRRTVELALQAVAWHMPAELVAQGHVTRKPAPGRQDDRGPAEGAIVFGTDQGMCGAFNDQIAEYVAEVRRAGGGRAQVGGAGVRGPVWAVGERLLPALHDAGLGPDRTFAAPGSVEGITGKVSELLGGFDQWIAGAGLHQVNLYFQRTSGPGTYHPTGVRLWPVDLTMLAGLRRRPWESRSLPVISLPWEDMLRPIIRQQLFIALYQGFAESLASENAARLAAMERAEKNIDERLIDLQREHNYLRQQTITVELLDIIAGYEALGGQGAIDRQPTGRR